MVSSGFPKGGLGKYSKSQFSLLHETNKTKNKKANRIKKLQKSIQKRNCKRIVKISKFKKNMSLVKKYIEFKKMHKSVLAVKDSQKKQEIISSYFSKEEYEEFKNKGAFPVWEENYVKKIIRECFKNKIEIEEIQQIPDYISNKTEILKSVSDHFIQQEINKALEIKTTNESIFRKLCLQYLKTGFYRQMKKKTCILSEIYLE